MISADAKLTSIWAGKSVAEALSPVKPYQKKSVTSRPKAEVSPL